MDTSGKPDARDEGGSIMAVAALEAPVEEPTAELTDEVRQQIVAARAEGLTLAELKLKFAPLSGDLIRSALPAGNARERKAKEAKTKVTETIQGVGGRSGKAKSAAKPKVKADPKPAPTPRYVEDLGDLPDRVVAARKVLGRKVLAEALGINESSCWRAEQGRIRPGEVKSLTDALVKVEARVTAGEFKKATRGSKAAAPSKAVLVERVAATVAYLRGDHKGSTGKSVAEAALALLDPQAKEAPADKS
jgi:hypothetical protein